MPRRAAPPNPDVVSTSVYFADETEKLGKPQLPPLQFTAASKEPPQTALFRLGVSPRGDVRYCFLETPSGDAALDEQARKYLVRARFPALAKLPSRGENELVWTTATIEWGNDIAAPSATSAKSRAP